MGESTIGPGMTLGLALPTSGAASSPEEMLRVAQRAEEIGLAAVWTFERLLRPVGAAAVVGGGPAVPLPEPYGWVYDPLETLSFVAAGTREIRLGTSVLVTLLHNPVVLARRLATLDRLSGGRLIAGIGQGWMADEFATAGVPPRQRGARFEEHVTAMRRVWLPDPVEFDGTFYRIAASHIGPKPVRPDGPALLAGAASPPAIERAARMGLGLNAIMMSWAAFHDTIEAFRRAAEAAGLDPDTLPVVVRVNGSITEKPLDGRAPLTGSAEQVLDDLARLGSAGADHVFWAMETEPDEQLDSMERLRAHAG
ncbi:TIGR03619 family F420-dependent LLM class oxidoreductase [Nonomuraea deserti]|uniref:TIGR03619 family F420-dependent LLM class oxidoreductase n=1 Tax=Nonomuraea deserti TaxID=1848322 RepID=A0A4R4VIT1_9ACTN|nr:TIGR03619 family F420-dependent LLM class oxidoreductase [Nonomuraea deserti]TDD03707.1 TIGR03619 family F420-dependent LLM class oxidoreductase [Nonomuraea deserti]